MSNENPFLSEDVFAKQESAPTPTPQPAHVPAMTTILTPSTEEKSQLLKQREMLRTQPDVQQLATKIDVKNQIAVLEFGKETAAGISQFSDRMLATMRTSKLEQSSVLLSNLNVIMDRFDPQDFKEEEKKKGLIKRIFNKGKEKLETVLAKYDTMNKEIDTVYQEVKKYEVEMKKGTLELEEMYNQNLAYFQELSKYIAAIDVKLDEIDRQLPVLESRTHDGNQLAIMEYETVRRARELLEQRRYDLEMAQQVSFQSAPQIRLLQQGNNHLISKINSAFVVTIPIFKQGLIQAVQMKRQKLIAESMSELDRRTNEMLVRNAENISQNSIRIAEMAGSPSIKIETIENTWQTIMSGIQETQRIQQETAQNRDAGRKRIEQLQLEYEKVKKGM
ncbi:MAG: toxic anion resistance protein [Caryophanon sp.]|nr:toxic anion resistance protein [Caryophanon sp.]